MKKNTLAHILFTYKHVQNMQVNNPSQTPAAHEIAGIYQYEAGSYWKHQHNDIKLIIAQRPPHQVTAKKPPYYLLYVDKEAERHYISGLYRLNPTSSKFTHKGYLLKLEAEYPDLAKCSRITISTLLHFLQHQSKKIVS